MTAVLAGFDVPAEGCGATALDRRHDLELGQAQVPCMGRSVGGPGAAEDIGDLKRGAHGAQPSGTTDAGTTIPSLSSGLTTAWTVRVATLV